MVARLVLGPLLRHVGRTDATVWVETDAPCEVAVLAGGARATAHTFQVSGHHYAIVCLDGLEPGTHTTYTVALDGDPAWPPPAYELPAPRIRTLGDGAPLRVLFGSCRVALPQEPPFTFTRDEDAWGFERDALFAYALRMRASPPEDWPDLMFCCGDQVYADELSPSMRAQVDRRRRDGVPGPPDEAADFEEYTMLYRDAWSDPVVRWFLSTVPTAMVFDDHDVHDDWNTSQSWMEDRRRLDWWEPKMAAALGSYWIYQHAGNLSPAHLAADEMWTAVGGEERGDREQDLWPRFERFGIQADLDHRGTRWSYLRELGPTRLVVMDSRGGRRLDPHDRRMVDADEWRWIERHATGDVEHLLLGTSLPWLMPPAIHDLERWDEAVAEGAWGRAAQRALGERVRRALDLEHWAAFGRSFLDVAELVRAVGAGERGAAPRTICALSGDVHHAYLAQASWPPAAGVRTPVWQATCSPVRNPLPARQRRAQQLMRRRSVAIVTRALARSARAYEAPLRWREVAGPSFDNQIASLLLDGATARLVIERACGHPAEPPRLETWLDRRLDGPIEGGPIAPQAPRVGAPAP